jgi:hypothetical protein
MLRSLPLILAVGLIGPCPASAAEAVRHVTLTAEVSSKSALRVSSQTLVFTVGQDGGSATASIEYSAAARTRSEGEVVLSIEWPNGAEGPGGGSDAETSLTVDDERTSAAALASGTLMAARWIGSGVRHGRFTFRLTAAAAGVYTVPVRLLISAP